MEKETFKTAQIIREKIQHFEVKKLQIKNMQERNNDEDFNTLRQLAFDGCQFAITTLENEFERL